MKKRLYIMRGLPGSGKSTVAAEIATAHEMAGRTVRILSADYHLINEKGEYEWTRERCSAAHAKVRRAFWHFIGHDCGQCMLGAECRDVMPERHCDVLLLDNTNSTHREFKDYKDAALAAGWEVFELTVGNLDVETSMARNKHSVPRESIERMRDRWQV